MTTPTDEKCAACGKGGDSLKGCTACKLVKYCGVDCQRAHRPKHKKECRKRAAELHDEALFKQPPSREECPICFLELPLHQSRWAYNPCCGKILCNGCTYASAVHSDDDPCPFCREPRPSTDEEEIKQIERRMVLKDAEAIGMMGQYYLQGELGLQQDVDKALGLFQKAAELGSINAHYIIGSMHCHGEGVQADNKIAHYHWEIAAMGGHMSARHNLGNVERREGNQHKGMKHWMISASAGEKNSLKGVEFGYRSGLITKDQFEKTLRAHKKSQDGLESEWRDKAAAANPSPLSLHSLVL